MKKTFTIFAIAGLVLIIMVSTVFGYGNVEGCIVDGASGLPWTHGGVVTSVQFGMPEISTDLDDNGCFSTSIGFNLEDLVVTVDPNAGPAGDPDPIDPYCTVPAEGSYDPYVCDTQPTDTGPNAITLQSINATATAPANWLVAALLAGFATLVGAFVLRKRSL